MKKAILISVALILIIGMSVSSALAQADNQLELRLDKDWGYAMGGDIQGTFSMKIKNPPDNLTRVVFYIDSTAMGESTQAPYNWRFVTDTYPLGLHTLSATGETSDGNQISSNIIQVNFVPATKPLGMVGKIILPIFGMIVILMVISFALPMIQNKGKLSSLPLGSQRNYGIGGGTICPKCNRPFPIRLWWMHIGTKKFDRCPYCGKWSFISRNSLSELRAAETAELSNVKPESSIRGESEAEKLKNDLDDSRYQDV